ncbi:predicted ATPase, AAA superfamily [Thermococcus kodakarensis KOD1]|uniref:Predicted ATPase, AAA superfamily n=1 Tax=Thermococcus kodakarensis (strain ATCC BAA-918 / JCM 12380 / KOD1) TaxID=69014 RepID=Q5JIK6_THEKO|nr:ATPase [Thermococcus kodakarensis]WCN27952.1 ATPase [Thermococcus kodakarensis]WCN30251.1 ATPase [Thermococcus kodakarensis]BAD86287.1 predicted ATPase, AAA superfamily [Thermococcus kodakarensis KOD1]
MERDGLKFYPSHSYDVYGLSHNPFEQLASEGIADVESIHVYQEVDMRLQMIISEVLGHKSSIALSIVGPLGMGKTQRLKNIAKAIEDNGGKAIYVKVDTNDILKLTRDIFYALKPPRSRTNIFLENLSRKLGFIDRLEKMLSDPNEYKSRDIAELLVEQLKKYPYSALLLDELENMQGAGEREKIQFFEMLRHVISTMPPGCIVAFACIPEAYEEYTKIFPAFFMRLHYEFKLRPMSVEETFELVKKRLNKARVKDTDDPIYPFTEEAIKLIHDLARGNPRQILRLLHYVLSEAAKHKFDPIDDYVVTTILEEPKSLEEYLMRIPKDYKDLVEAVVFEFKGGPVSYIQVAKAVKKPGMQVYESLNELVRLGFLVGDPNGSYKVPDYVRKFLEEGQAEKLRGE